MDAEEPEELELLELLYPSPLDELLEFGEPGAEPSPEELELDSSPPGLPLPPPLELDEEDGQGKDFSNGSSPPGQSLLKGVGGHPDASVYHRNASSPVRSGSMGIIGVSNNKGYLLGLMTVLLDWFAQGVSPPKLNVYESWLHFWLLVDRIEQDHTNSHSVSVLLL